MASIKQAYNTSGTMTLSIASLTDGSGRGGTAVDNTSGLYINADIEVKVKTGGSGTSSTGYINVYLIRSADGTTYDDGFGGTDASYTPVNAILLGTIAVSANATTYYGLFDTAQLGITLPKKWSIGILNKSGGTLDTTAGNHEVKYTEKYLTVA